MKSFLKKHYGLIFIVFAFVAIIFKNIILVGNMVGPNHFYPNFANAFSSIGLGIFTEMAVMLLFFSFCFLFKGKGRFIYILVLDIVFTVLLFVDICYCRFFLGAPSLYWITLPKNTGNDSAFDITEYVSLLDVLFILDCLILIAMLVVGIKKKLFVTPRKTKVFSISLIVSMFVLVFPAVLPSRSETYNSRSSLTIVKNFTSLGFHIYDAFTFSNVTNSIELSTKEKEEILSYYEDKDENLPDNEEKGILGNSNLIFIQTESMESFVINQSINGEEITPNINRLLDSSYYFTGIHEQVNSGNSSDCDLMVITGMLPVSFGITYTHFPEMEYYSLAEMLKDKNNAYSLYFNAAESSTWNYKAVLTSTLGFDEMNFTIPSTERVGAYISDKAVFDYAFDKISNVEGNFYSHIVLCSSHIPFDIPEAEKTLNVGSKLGIMGNYLQAIHYVDKQIGAFVDNLETAGLLDNTTIVIIGDHGGVHKYCGQKVDKYEKEYPWMGDSGHYTMPLVVYNKALSEKTFDVIGGQVDILPTLTYMYDIPTEDIKNQLIGRPLVNTELSFAYSASGKLFGTLTDEERKIYSKCRRISDLAIRSNYFLKSGSKVN